ncbi:MAG: Crp/Fnr family transcriptional regulator [Thermodesulfobacteriota bacterium]
MGTNWHLKEKDFFEGLSEEKKHFLLLSQKRQYRRNEFIFFEGDVGHSAFYLEKGAVQIFKSSQVGKDLIVWVRKSGELFGLAEIMGEQERKCNARAITDCLIHRIERRDFEHLLSRHYPMVQRVIQIMGRRVRYLCEQVENLMVCDVTTRLLKLFVYLCYQQLAESGAWDQPATLPLSLTQEQMAAMTGTCQQTVSEVLKRLQEDGVISVANRCITLVSPTEVLDRLS